MAEDEEYQYAMQELEDVLLSQDNPTLTDAMTELSDVMEKMTRFTEELNQDSQWSKTFLIWFNQLAVSTPTFFFMQYPTFCMFVLARFSILCF